MKFGGTGVAAIVGPNGCGKSNLSDAISWVLGEQSAKTLRGARMEDVIFAGTQDKKPLGMASVTMTLIPDEPPSESPDAKPLEHEQQAQLNGHRPHPSAEVFKTAERTGEITITRRLYRSGESEYLMNGKLARLRDIQDLFLGTGLGPESYAIIEQGRIGQILSNRPQDRRNVIEEAAGITKFKARKRLAESKLESAKQNLSRVFDILEEVTRQVNSLKRQAAKTKRYGELKVEAKSCLRQVISAKFRILERDAAKLAIELNLASSELESLYAEITEGEKRKSTRSEALYATERDLTEARRLAADLELESERLRGRLEYQAKQIQEIDRQSSGGQQELESLHARKRETAADLERRQSEFSMIEAEYATARLELEAKSKERIEIQTKLAEQERKLEGARQRVLELLTELSSLKHRITHSEAQLGTIDTQSADVSDEERRSAADLSRLESVRVEISERLTARQIQLNSTANERQAIETGLHDKRAEMSNSRQALERLRAEFSRVKARRDSLQDILHHRSYTTETVKRFFTAVEQANTHFLQPVGVLADFLEVDSQFEKAVEEFLHDELEYVIVRNWDEAERGLELMRADLNGRATFLVEESGPNARAPESREPSGESGIVTKLSDAVRFTNGISRAALHSLPRIANSYVVTDRAEARRLAMEYPDCWFLVSEGISYHGQAVSGGKKTGSGPLALKRELREISVLEADKERELNATETNFECLGHTIAELGEKLEHVRAHQQSQEKDMLAIDHESRKLAEELQRVRSKLSGARLQLQELSQAREEIHRNIERDREALQQVELVRTEQDQVLESARREESTLRARAAHAAEEHAILRANVASLEERQRSLIANRERLTSEIESFVTRTELLSSEMKRLSAERAQFISSNEEIDRKVIEVKDSISSAEQSADRLVLREAELRQQLRTLEDELKHARSTAQIALEKRSEVQVALARTEADLKHLDETCQRELETSLGELAADHQGAAEGSALEDLENKYADVQRKIEALGPVNPQALEEFEEAQQRQDFLNAQRQDLLDSIRDTEKAIHQIDDESRKRFTEAFHAINTNFREMFATLFGGGVGEMRLSDEENVSESGIDIVASPPGKKLQNVLLLSGGEKSLTAMALLMAIFQYTPSPFCVLDEVDAPLDEPNIERLTTLLKDMSAQTQFIVITHAKRTMEAAQTLYGVTMQEPGVSKLVSVKFEPYAERPIAPGVPRISDKEVREPAYPR